jgi:hypothetical protein
MTITNDLANWAGTGANSSVLIANGGNVGIGTSSPSTLFEVSNTSTTSTITSTATSGYSVLSLRNTGTSGRSWQVAVGGSATGVAGSYYAYDATAAAIRMLIDSSGNMGIGTSSPSTYGKLAVSGNLYAGDLTTNSDGTITIGSAGAGSVAITRTGSGATSSSMTFSTTYATLQERMRIDSSGNVMVGVTTASGKFTVVQNAAAIGGYFQSTIATPGYHGVYAEANSSYGVYGKTYNASYGGVLGYNSNNTAFGILGYSTYGFYSASSINVAGTIYTSDARLKENIKPILNSLDILSALNPVSFDWKEKSSRGPSSDFGLIAQEVEQVIPECVFETTTPGRTPEMTHEVSLEEELGTYKGVDYSRFIPFLIAAVKELSAKNQELLAKNGDIEQRLALLEANK